MEEQDQEREGGDRAHGDADREEVWARPTTRRTEPSTPTGLRSHDRVRSNGHVGPPGVAGGAGVTNDVWMAVCARRKATIRKRGTTSILRSR